MWKSGRKLFCGLLVLSFFSLGGLSSGWLWAEASIQGQSSAAQDSVSVDSLDSLFGLAKPPNLVQWTAGQLIYSQFVSAWKQHQQDDNELNRIWQTQEQDWMNWKSEALKSLEKTSNLLSEANSLNKSLIDSASSSISREQALAESTTSFMAQVAEERRRLLGEKWAIGISAGLGGIAVGLLTALIVDYVVEHTPR